MRLTYIIAIVALWLDLGLALPLTLPSLEGFGEIFREHEPRRLGGLGGFGKGIPKLAPPKAAPPKAAPPKAAPPKAAPPKAAPSKAAPPPKVAPSKAAPSEAAPSKAAPSKAASSKAAPSEAASSKAVSSKAAASIPPSSSKASQAAVTSKASSPASVSQQSTPISSQQSTIQSSSADPLAQSAWPQPTIAGASPPSLAAAKAAKPPAFPNTKPKINANSSALYDSQFDQEAGVPADLQKKSPPAINHPELPVPAGVECPDTTADMLKFGFMTPIPAGQAMFYSGVDVGTTRGNVPPSKKFADAHNIGLLKDFVTDHARKSNVVIQKNCPTFWTLASQFLAEQVSGNVAVLMNPIDTTRNTDPRAWPFLGTTTTAAWRKPEWPALQKNVNVCSVWRFDVKGNAVMLFQRPGCDAKKPF